VKLLLDEFGRASQATILDFLNNVRYDQTFPSDFCHHSPGATYLVENGWARAEIVIAEKPLRSVRLAAQELQDRLRKISGAHLPIVKKPARKRCTTSLAGG
jgi:hypothetical protein